MTSPRRDIIDIVRAGRSFLVAAHVSPDGDAIGATSALGWILTLMGKDVTLYNASPMPAHFEWMNLPKPLTREIGPQLPDWTFLLDSGDERRVGEELHAMLDKRRTVVIDHHLGNPGFGAVNWIDPTRSSVGEMIGDIAGELGIPLTGPLAEAVYVAIVSDTGRFSYSNTTPSTHEMAALMIRNGLEPARIMSRLDGNWSLARIRLMSRVLGDLQTYFQGKLGVICIPKRLFEETGTGVEDTDGLINTVRSLKGVLVAMSLREDGDGRIKFSLRSKDDVDVQAVAARLGGGGHKNASGGTLPGTIEDACERLVDALSSTLGAADPDAADPARDQPATPGGGR